LPFLFSVSFHPSISLPVSEVEVLTVVVPEMLQYDRDDDNEPAQEDIEVVFTSEVGNALQPAL
jgi:hypothetical protein